MNERAPVSDAVAAPASAVEISAQATAIVKRRTLVRMDDRTDFMAPPGMSALDRVLRTELETAESDRL